MVYIIIARYDAKVLYFNVEKGDKCKNIMQIQSKSTKMRAMRC